MKKPTGSDPDIAVQGFTQDPATGSKVPRNDTDVEAEVKAMGIDPAVHYSGPNNNQGGN